MANSPLDHYLETMEGRLKSLAPARRQEELQEVRQHLEALVAGHRMAGLSEDEAVAAAIRQFGHAEQVGQALSQASQQKHVRSVMMLLALFILTVAVNIVIFAINDYPDTWFAKFVMAFALSAGLLGMAVAEIVQTYWRTLNKQNRS